MIDLHKIWEQFHSELEAELKHTLSRVPTPLYNMMRYHMGWTDKFGGTRSKSAGKRLRPFFCLYVCQELGGDWRQALPAAAAIELMHNYSLVHDDIEDASTLRRGRPSVWHIWGQPQAINAGDSMHALALLSMLRLEGVGVPHLKVVRSANSLEEANLRLCEGQYRDMSYEQLLDVSVKDYLSMISGKTAALFRCSLEIGALIATDNDSIIRSLSNYGHALGMLFQVQDDILSIWGDEQITGKPSTSDIEMRKKTLPVIYALRRSRGANRERLRNMYRKETLNHDNVSDVMLILNNINALGYAQEIKRRYYQKALSELNEMDIPESNRLKLEAIAAFLVNRVY